jgi:hypothetical protein
MGTAGSVEKKPQSPYHRLCDAKVRKAKKMRIIDDQASEFYFHCSNGEIDKVREILQSPDRRPIDEFIKIEPNGNTALHIATEKGHVEIVKLILEHRCPRTILNRHGRIAAEEATTSEMEILYIRPGSTGRFLETDTARNVSIYLPVDAETRSTTNNTDVVTDVTKKEALEYFQSFKSEKEVYTYSLNQQTTAMWLRFYNWFSRTFPSLFHRDNLQLDAFHLHNNTDFDDFLKRKLSEENCEQTRKAIREAHGKNSIDPLITLYTNENTGFYKSLNKQLADSPFEATNSPHLCERFTIEFHLRADELKDRMYTGITYRGATMTPHDLSLYEKVLENKPRGVITFKAFTSTSEAKTEALVFAKTDSASDRLPVLYVFEIKSKSPTILGIGDISEFTDEMEVLLVPGNLFVVKKVVKNQDHYTKEKQKITLTEIHLQYLHMPVSVFTKVHHTYKSAYNSVM